MIAAARLDVPVRVEVSGRPLALADDVRVALLRIAQEAIANAARYARARRIQVALGYGAGQIELRVEDDGEGMAGGPDPGAGHFGIVGMRERAGEIGGTLEIRSGAGTGTAVCVRVPLREAPS
jgi:signal transduction histidine kinase